jgi:hypothetical protein
MRRFELDTEEDRNENGMVPTPDRKTDIEIAKILVQTCSGAYAVFYTMAPGASLPEDRTAGASSSYVSAPVGLCMVKTRRDDTWFQACCSVRGGGNIL